MFYRSWKNLEGQLSLIQQILRNSDIFSFADHHHHKVKCRSYERQTISSPIFFIGKPKFVKTKSYAQLQYHGPQCFTFLGSRWRWSFWRPPPIWTQVSSPHGARWNLLTLFSPWLTMGIGTPCWTSFRLVREVARQSPPFAQRIKERDSFFQYSKDIILRRVLHIRNYL